MLGDPVASRPRWQARLPFFYGWLIVGLAFFTTFFGIGLTWAASLFAVPMREDLGWGNAAFFFALSLRGWTGIVVTPFVGPYLDRMNGTRVFMFIGGGVNVASLVLISFVQAEWQFVLLFGVMGGVAQACQAGSNVIIPKWFIRNRGMAVSLSSAGGGLAAFLLPPLLIALDSSIGWRGSWIVLGVLALIFSTLPAFFLHRQPEDLGLLPDGDGGRKDANGRAPRPPMEDFSFTRQEAVRTSTFWILMVAVALGALAANGMPANMTNIFVERGLAFDVAATGLIFYGIASLIGKVVWGWLANRLPLRKVLLLLTAYGTIALPVIVIIPSSVGSPAVVYGALVGFYVGAYIPLHFLVWAAYFGRAHVGAISGVGRPLGAVFLSGGPFVIAFTRDLFGTYSVGILFAAAGVAAAFVCLFFLKPPSQPVREEPSADPPPTEAVAAPEKEPSATP